MANEFGFLAKGESVKIERIIKPEAGVSGHGDKYVVSLPKYGGSFFVGSCQQYWPSDERVEAAVGAITQAALLYPYGIKYNATAPHVRLVSYLRSIRSGTFVVKFPDISDLRFFCTSAVDQQYKTLDQIDGITLDQIASALASALGSFHMMVRIPPPLINFIEHHQRPASIAEHYINDFRMWTQKGSVHSLLNSGSDIEMLNEYVVNVEYIIKNRGEVIDGLPHYWLHDDFQAKNVMSNKVMNSLFIIDTTDMTFAPRVYDFYYVLLGLGDANSKLRKPPSNFLLDKDEVSNLFLAYFNAGEFHN